MKRWIETMVESILSIDGVDFFRAKSKLDYKNGWINFKKINNPVVEYSYRIGQLIVNGYDAKQNVFSRFGYGFYYGTSIAESLKYSSNDYAFGDNNLAHNLVYGTFPISDYSSVKLSIILPAYGVSSVIQNVVKAISLSCSMIPALDWEAAYEEDQTERLSDRRNSAYKCDHFMDHHRAVLYPL